MESRKYVGCKACNLSGLFLLMLLSLLLPYHTNATARLLNEGGTITGVIDQAVTIRCQFEVDSINDIAVMNTKGLLAYMVRVTDSGLSSPLQITAIDTTQDITTSQSEIMPTDPPSLKLNITFQIPRVSRSHKGEYACQAGLVNIKFQLEVEGPPFDIDLTTSSDNVILTKLSSYDQNRYSGSSAVWKSEVDIDRSRQISIEAKAASQPGAEITWQAKDSSMTVSHKEVTLETDSLKTEYICSARNSYGVYNITIIVEAQYKPRKPVIGDPDLYPEEGKEMRTQCEFDAEPPAIVFYVKEDPVTKMWHRIHDRNNDDFYIPTVDLDRDIGTYKCIGENKHGNSSGIIKVHGKPRDVNIVIGERYGNGAEVMLRAFSALPVKFTLVMESNMTDHDEVTEKIWLEIDRREYQVVPNIEVHRTITSLDPETDYILRIIASNAHGNATSVNYHMRTLDANVTIPPTTTASLIKTTTMGTTKAAEQVSSSSSIITLCTILTVTALSLSSIF